MGVSRGGGAKGAAAPPPYPDFQKGNKKRREKWGEREKDERKSRKEGKKEKIVKSLQ